MHHEGAGTTAAGIKLGKPTVVVLLFVDQPFWGHTMAYKSYAENRKDNFNKAPDVRGPPRIRALLVTHGAQRGRAHQMATATLRYARDSTITGCKAECRSQTSLESVY